MKTRLITSTCLAFAIVSTCAADNGFQPIRDVLRTCVVDPIFSGNSSCQNSCPTTPSAPCGGACSGEVVVPGGEIVGIPQDEPSELNILLTTELVALREQVKAMETAASQRDEAMEVAKKELAAEREKCSQLQKKMAGEMKRAKQAGTALAKVKEELNKASEELAKTKKASAAATSQAKKNLTKAMEASTQLKQQNGKLEQQLSAAKKQLEKSKAAAANGRKKRENERRKRAEDNAAAKEEEATSDAADEQADGGADSE